MFPGPRLSFVALVLSGFADCAWADLAQQHMAFDRLMLPGGRAAMLGGAYTALSDDPSGLFYNPAGIAQGTQNQMSLNTWSSNRSQVSYKEAILGDDFTESSNTLLGGFAGGVFHKKWFTLGYVIATLDKRIINQNDYFYDITSEEGLPRDFTRIHQESDSYDLFGSAIAFALGKSWSLGFAAFYYDRKIEAMDFQQVQYNGGQVLVQQDKVRVANQGFHESAGLQYRGEDLSIGVSVRSGNPVINKGSRSRTIIRHAVEDTVPDVETSSNDAYATETEVIPNLYRFGAAWHPASGFLLTTDVSYSAFAASNGKTPDRQPTWNYACGLETGLTNWRFMLGVFTNNSLFPKLTDGEDQSAHIDYIGRAIGTSIITKSFDLHVGYVRQDGRGYSQIIGNSRDQQRVEARMENLLLSWTFKL